MISRLDAQVGQVMALLRELGIDDDTLVFFSSDNGAQSGGKDDGWTAMTDFFRGNGPLRGYKGQWYEGGIRVPFIARWPGRIPPGTTSDHICGFWDILPTLAEIAGVASPARTDGISIVPTLTAQGEQRRHRAIYWEYPAAGGGISRAARMDRWKAIQNRPKARIELYDLSADISEAKDIAGESPRIVAELAAFMDNAHEPLRDFPKQMDRTTVDDYVR
jgi:arylsulfatase A-like enzyme